MRLVKVSAPQGKGTEIARIAFNCGIPDVSIQQLVQHKPGAEPASRDVVDAKVSTPHAKAFVDALVDAPFFNREDYAIEVREPRTILKSAPIREMTRPFAAPTLDICHELWQFTHVTYSFGLRVLCAALLLAYGLVEDNPLFIIGGLIFLPLMPIVLAFSFGVLSKQWQLAAHAAIAFVTAIILIVAGAAIMGTLLDPPVMFDKFPPIAAGLGFSLVVGVAAAIGTADDVGHRQLVGLAAASQLAILPAWFGVSLVFGFSESPVEKLGAFGVNVAALIGGSLAVYAALSAGGEIPHRAATRKQYDI